MSIKSLYETNGQFWKSKNGNGGESHGIKVLKEAVEFSEEPSLKEAADVIIATMSWCHARGYSWEEVFDAVSTKADINFNRNWERQPDGTWQHL